IADKTVWTSCSKKQRRRELCGSDLPLVRRRPRMLSFLGRSVRLCDGLSRREVLRVGGLGVTGLAWSHWLRSRATAMPPASVARRGRSGQARACILILNHGGPPHLDIWDLKPDAPAEIRGEFRPAPTCVPGIQITEHLPRLARLADRYAIVR